ncbi:MULTISPECIES: hypothetical protein [unclassified Actinobaculum]|uniref:hypothetical protein n=1 Tax=unclassified Actinobaculum TaxID=2609299 RepID=UPI000D529A96|nr:MULTISPECIES: hypothetical protein [unclassified Actinobaculum]AWE42567.1 hypothetical protein DDD63_07155 [Actinobaculum sp. 313]RTE48787.1 hypothetical protein EKN07_08755 [Actinobaculum sp. 352]
MNNQLIAVAREVLAREGVPEAEHVDINFSLRAVDRVTRWAVAVAIESAGGGQLTDEQICAAQTIRDLLP